MQGHALRAPVGIIGGGIGGTFCALLLSRAGYDVHLFEQRSNLNELAYGLQLTPNAMRLLIKQGLDSALAPSMLVPEGLTLWDGCLNLCLRHLPLPKPYGAIARQALMSCLHNELRKEKSVLITTDARVEGIQQTDTNYRLETSQGRFSVCAVVQATGVNAQTLSETLPVPDQLDSTLITWRSRLSCSLGETMIKTVNLFLGDGCHGLVYALEGGQATNVVISEAGLRAKEAGHPDLTNLFPEWLIDELAMGEANWRLWPLKIRDAEGWHSGSGALTLLGDAAHALPPFLAQGAAMALEDAATLVKQLQKFDGDFSRAFRRYEAIRKPRVSAVQKASLFQAKLYHAPKLLRGWRNRSIRFAPASLLIARANRIFDYKIED